MRVECEFIGKTALLMHADMIEARDDVADWGALNKEERLKQLAEAADDIAGRNVKSAGDDRLPPWRWQHCLHHDWTHIAIPREYIQGALRHVAKSIKDGRSTLMSESQTTLFPDQRYYPILVKGKPIPVAKIHAMRLWSFARQQEEVKKFGFELDCKSAVNKATGARHIRVRPMFSTWSVNAVVKVTDQTVWNDERLMKLFSAIGDKAGFGDWRPNSKTPGPYGTFTTKIKIVS